MLGSKRRVKNTVLVFLLVSALVHITVVGLVNLTADSTKRQVTPPENLEIVIYDSSPKRIVEQDEQKINDETPEKAKFLGRHNQTVVEETRALNFGDFKNTAGTGANPMAKASEAAAKRAQSAKGDTAGTLPSLANLNPRFDFSESRKPLTHTMADAPPPSSTNDHLKDLAPGIQTLLSSKEFVYYTYYQRIRSQIRQHWEPSIREKVRRIFAQGRSIASTRDHVTRVIIVLNPQGELIGVQVVGGSGVKDLDDAAVEAFRAAQPFPNPPKGIVDTDGTIKINWDFILEA